MIGYREEPLESQLPKSGEYWRIRGSNAIKQVKSACSGEVKFTDGTIRNIAALVERVPPEGLPQKTMVEKFCQYADEVGLEKAIWGIYERGRLDAIQNTRVYPPEPSPASMGLGITPPQPAAQAVDDEREIPSPWTYDELNPEVHDCDTAEPFCCIDFNGYEFIRTAFSKKNKQRLQMIVGHLNYAEKAAWKEKSK